MTGRTSTARLRSRPRGAALPLPAAPLALTPSAGCICKVTSVHGTLEDVPVRTYSAVPPWGTLPYSTWRHEFIADSVGQPHP